MPIALRARYVYPVDRPAIEHGVVTIDGERIVSVDARSEVNNVVDLGDVALVPGLVNCHTHLEFSDVDSPLGSPGIRPVDWIRLIIAHRASCGTFRGSSVLRGVVECLRSGVTSIGEIMQGFAVGPTDGIAEMKVLDLFLEVIGFSRARADSTFMAAVERLDTLARRVKASIGISPHAPYTVSPQLVERLVVLACKRSLPVAMHIAESKEELQLLATSDGPFQELLDERSMWDPDAIPRGSRPMDYLRMLAEAPRALVIHGNYLVDEELECLGGNAERMSLVYCPRTHAYFRHAPYPLMKALQKGVRVALGTDSRASNPDLSLLAEMRYVAREFSAVDPNTVLRMGTLAGAEALGRDAELGSISSGKHASLIAIPLEPRLVSNAEDALNALLAGNAMPSKVWVRGIEWDE